ncbi:MAG: peptidylprolyl isomerase [bacterium]
MKLHNLILCFMLLMIAGCQPEQTKDSERDSEDIDGSIIKVAVIETDKGIIKFELYEKDAPKTVENFIRLSSKKFYDGLTFHRVVPGFVVQGGDPMGDGSGGPDYNVPAEINERSHLLGTVAAARLPDYVNPQKASSGSQFYICLAPQSHLDGEYTIFGQVIEGMDVVQNIVAGDKMNKVYVTEK